jgi:hypothetical protein
VTPNPSRSSSFRPSASTGFPVIASTNIDFWFFNSIVLSHIFTKGLIESEITERILKSTVSVIEAFNNVRNNQSFAHDNIILNYNENLLIFGHVTSSIRFIDALEMQNKPSSRQELELPF